VRLYTVHLAPGRAPVLVREGFSVGALVFGPLWLFFHRAWIAGWLALALNLALAAAIARNSAIATASLAEFWLLGLLGRDLYRWGLARRGYALSHVLAARDKEAALARLLAARPDLAATLAR